MFVALTLSSEFMFCEDNMNDFKYLLKYVEPQAMSCVLCMQPHTSLVIT